ncbi:YraN family protein [Patescibacteria group bacterium AH-259-L05]|nr:YraN family protein [Patescibacteria group bacterium AH-259-L05]
MQTQRQKLGKRGEDIAVRYLKKNTYTIIEQNYRAGKYGEIDIIARKKDQLVFVEVKAKSDTQFGDPEQELTYFKTKKLHRAIQNYLFKHSLQDREWRLDLIAIEIPPCHPARPRRYVGEAEGSHINLRHYKHIH